MAHTLDVDTSSPVPAELDFRHLHGPFDLIGDVHGQAHAFGRLLEQMGYATDGTHPQGRIPVLVGDLNDKGPDTPSVFALAAPLLASGGLMVDSNHGAALVSKVGRLQANCTTASQIAEVMAKTVADDPKQVMTRLVGDTVEQFAALGEPAATEQLSAAVALSSDRPHQILLDRGRLLVVHGGVLDDLVAVASKRASKVALFGTPRGTGDDGRPAGRDSWREDYAGAPMVVYGHVAYPDGVSALDRAGEPVDVVDGALTASLEQIKTVGVDTGAGDGVSISALRYPELTLVSVPIT